MAVKVISSTVSLFALTLLAAAAGCCCQAIPLPGENDCPTDARRLYCSCGEEAVRRCPCGPGSEFYGLKPTCWREWPEGWHCNGCEGMPYVDPALCGAPVAESSAYAEETHAAPGASNPFRPDAGAAELPTPPEARPTTPTQSAPAKTTSTQPRHAARPSLEPAPTENAPANKTTNGKPTVPGTGVAVAQLNAPVATPPVAPGVQAEATEPQSMPLLLVADAIKIPAPTLTLTAPALTLMAPLNAPKAASVAESNLKQTVETTELSKAKDPADDSALSDRVEQHLINNLRL